MAEDLENHTIQTENHILHLENRIPLSNYNPDPGYVRYLHHSDDPNCTLSSDPFTGNNCAQWKRSREVPLTAKNKMSFVTGEYPKPTSNSPLLPL